MHILLLQNFSQDLPFDFREELNSITLYNEFSESSQMVRIIATNGPPERWLDIRRKIFFIKGLLWGVIWLYKGKSHSIVSFSFEGGSTIKGGGCYITFLREKRWQGVICTIQHRNIFELCNRQNLSFCLFCCPIREMVIKI